MDWRIKGAIQKVLGYVPGGSRIHYRLQRRVGGLSDFARECDLKLEDWSLMMGHLRTSNIALSGATLLEIGTGWYPTFPFCLYLAGAKRVLTFDLNRHLAPDLATALVERLAQHVPLIARESGRDPAEVAVAQERLAIAIKNGASINQATQGAVEYHAPADAADTRLPAASIDVVFSNSVLEHVPGPVIVKMMGEAMRILVPGGVVFHSVNCGDHYAYTDAAISQLHYLRYSEAEWAWWNNEFLYQNRLRARDFTEMAKDAGFTIEIDTSRPHPERLAQLAAVDVHPSFLARYSRDQLAITSIDFVGRKR